MTAASFTFDLEAERNSYSIDKTSPGDVATIDFTLDGFSSWDPTFFIPVPYNIVFHMSDSPIYPIDYDNWAWS